MSSFLKNGILENIDTVRRIPVGRFWGVTLLITPFAWLGPFIFFALHLVINLINTRLGLTEHLYQAMIFAIAVEISTFLHAFGHILSGKIVRSPMDELLIATTRDVNIYHGDQSSVLGYVHIVRSLGGPTLNLLIAGICYAFEPMITQGFWHDLFSSLILVNLFFGIGGFLPVPTVDGEVIWREMIKLIHTHFQKRN